MFLTEAILEVLAEKGILTGEEVLERVKPSIQRSREGEAGFKRPGPATNDHCAPVFRPDVRHEAGRRVPSV